MYNNSPSQLYNSNMHAPRTAVDALLKDLGAEPLFSSINDPPPGIPTPLNTNNYKQPPVMFNQSNSNAFSDAFISLLQKINQQNTNISNIQNVQNPQHIQNTPNSQIFGQGIQQNQQFGPSNQVSSNQIGPSNQVSSNQVGLPNPISILNEMHQRNRRSSIPPKYIFSMDSTTGHFYCQLEVFGKVFRTERPTLRKQQAKEDVALMALRNFVNENNPSDGNRKVIGSDIMKLYDPSFNYSENRTDNVCKSEIWYRKQMSEFQGKQPRVILLEFCQMHRLPNPAFHPCNDYNGNTYFECIVGDKYFRSDKSFVRSNEAKDYVAGIAFDAIYKEICERERRNDMVLNTTSNLNSNVSSPLSNFSSSLDSSLSSLSSNTSQYTNFGTSFSSVANSGQFNTHSSVANSGQFNTHSSVANSGQFNTHSSVANSGQFNTHSSVVNPGQFNTHSSVVNPGQFNTNLNVANPGHLSMSSPHSSVISPSGITNSHLSTGSLHSGMTNPGHLSMGGSHSSVTNSHLSMGSPHSNVSSPLTNISNPCSQITNITSPHLPNSNVSSPLSSSHLNINGPHSNVSSSHLNEITSSLVLPNFNHEAPIKVEDANPVSPNMESIIKIEEGNIRDQLQASSISYHPYRAPGRERSSTFNNNNNNNNNNQFAKKNAGFCKKFTSLLYEMAQSKRWSPPEFNFENGISGFICTCSIQDCLFRGKAFSRKNDAKESAAEEAYRFLTRNRG